MVKSHDLPGNVGMSPGDPPSASPLESRRTTRGTCSHNCPDTCGLLYEVEDGRAVSVKGDPNHPYTQGWLCIKVNHYLERVASPDRLRYPLHRSGPKGSGRFSRIGWDEAMAEIAGRWKDLIQRHGAESILPYSFSGTCGTVQNSAMEGRLFNRMGVSNLDRTICDMPGAHALLCTIGDSLGADPEDVVNTKLLIIWGANPVSTHPHYVPFVAEAKRRGARVILIDPRRSRTAAQATDHVAPYPGTDAALALGMTNLIFQMGLADDDFLHSHGVGAEALRERAAEFPVSRTAEITRLSEAVIRDLAIAYGTAKPACIRVGWGIQRHSNGGQTMRSIACLPAVTGQYGVSGGGMLFSNMSVKWNGEALGTISLRRKPVRSINMNRIGEALLRAEPPVRSLYVFNGNPAAVAPAQEKVLAGLRREDLFTVVHDLFQTDTADYADVVLPAASPLEQFDLHRSTTHQYLQINRPAIDPPGEAKTNVEVFRLLATAMGYDDPVLQQSAEEIAAGLIDRGHGPRLAGMEFADLFESGHRKLDLPAEHWIPFADRRFRTPSGKVELFSKKLADEGHDPLPNYEPLREGPDGSPELHKRYPLQLLTPGAHHFTSSSFANVPSLQRLEGEPAVEINPADAAARDVVDGEMVETFNERGRCMLKARVTDAVQPGVIVSDSVWWHKHSPGGRNVNVLTPDSLADFAGGSTFHTNLVEIRPWPGGDPASEGSGVIPRRDP